MGRWRRALLHDEGGARECEVVSGDLDPPCDGRYQERRSRAPSGAEFVTRISLLRSVAAQNGHNMKIKTLIESNKPRDFHDTGTGGAYRLAHFFPRCPTMLDFQPEGN